MLSFDCKIAHADSYFFWIFLKCANSKPKNGVIVKSVLFAIPIFDYNQVKDKAMVFQRGLQFAHQSNILEALCSKNLQIVNLFLITKLFL